MQLVAGKVVLPCHIKQDETTYTWFVYASTRRGHPPLYAEAQNMISAPSARASFHSSTQLMSKHVLTAMRPKSVSIVGVARPPGVIPLSISPCVGCRLR